jgi:putative Ca2+/H+ antiporter (TMEM165/GDT1 family)
VVEYALKNGQLSRDKLNWSVVFTTFGLIFVAELGDKTQLAVLTQTCKYRRPWAVFLGASLALTAVTALGAAGGQVLGRIIPASFLQGIAAVAFVVMGVLIGREALQAEAEASIQGEACDYLPDERQESSIALALARNWKAFGSTFGLLFVAEMGDKTQLAMLSLAGKRAESLPVFIGGALALTMVTAVGVIGGQALGRILPKRTLLWISAAAFVVMGVLIGFGVL